MAATMKMRNGALSSTAAAVACIVAVLITAPAARGAPKQSGVERRIDRLIRAMPIRARMAQLLFVGFEGTEADVELRRLAGEWHVGAIALYSANISSTPQLQRLTRDIRAMRGSAIPPFIAVDQEGGEVARIGDSVPILPGNMALGATRSPELARRAGRALGADLRRLGITMNLAPVLDRASTPDSAIGIRSFGEDPELVGTLGRAFIEGQSESGMAVAAKHFPGLGAARQDSHDALPVIPNNESDLAPFRAAVASGTDAVLLAHAVVPNIDEHAPVMLSKKAMALLRDELRFDGIVITDALEMAAVDRSEGVGRVAVRAILNGADMVMVLWQARDREEVLAALEASYRSGQLTDTRLRTSLRRILRAKLRRRLWDAPPAGDASRDDVGEDIAARSITVLRAESTLLPLPENRAGIVYIGPGGPIADAVQASQSLHPPVRFTDREKEQWSAQAARIAGQASVLVAAAQNRSQMEVIRAARDANPHLRVLLISLGSPQLIDQLPDAAVYVCAYSYLLSSQRAVARVLTGQAIAPGRTPVAVPGV
jgi:beta-N-acetylhexosaminidase